MFGSSQAVLGQQEIGVTSMSTIVLRSVKNAPLTNAEVDSNFTNLNNDKTELGGTYSSGTANGVLFLSASKVLTTGSALTFDGTNLGIGTSSPTAKLSVSGTSTGSAFVAVAFSNEGLTAGSTVRLNFLSGEDGTVGRTRAIIEASAPSTNDGALIFQTRLAGTVAERMRIDSAGNVGIGTSSPATTLTVQSSGANLGGLANTLAGLYDPTTTAGVRAVLGFATTDGGANPWVHGAIGAVRESSTVTVQSGGLALFTRPSSGSLAERLRITSAGNVGIGTSSPLRPLSSANSSAEAQIFAGRTATGGNLGNSAAGGRISLGSTSTATGVGYEGARIGMIAAQAWTVGSAQGANLVFETTATGTATLTERMRIDSSGNVGIGTSSPTYKLNVVSNGAGATLDLLTLSADAAATGGNAAVLNFKAASDLMTIQSASSDALAFGTANTERMRITSTGNVGIGTSAPSAKLELSDATAPVYVIQTRGSLQTILGPVGTNLGDPGQVGTTTNSPFRIVTNNTERMRIDTAGNLGLGVTPSAWYTSFGTKAFQFAASGALYGLDVSSADRRVELANNSYLNAAGVDTYTNTGHASKYQQRVGAHAWYTAPSGTAGAAITFTQAMTLDASGNLGIGTTSPGAKLQITEPSASSSVEHFRILGGQYTGTQFSNGFRFYTNTNINSNRTHTFTSTGGNLTVGGIETSTGNVAIDMQLTLNTNTIRVGTSNGTATPGNITISAPAGTGTDIAGGSLTLTGGASTGSGAGGPIVFSTAAAGASGTTVRAATERMRITSTGNVGIGTSSPSFVTGDGVHIRREGTATLRVERTGATASAGEFFAGNDQVVIQSLTATAPLAFRTGGNPATERMRIDSDGNVGIGTASPNASAILDAQSTTKGVRMPNMTTTQKNAIASPAAGLMVFDTTLAKLCVYSGAAWETITSS
jgi:hypothetical protein